MVGDGYGCCCYADDAVDEDYEEEEVEDADDHYGADGAGCGDVEQNVVDENTFAAVVAVGFA